MFKISSKVIAHIIVFAVLISPIFTFMEMLALINYRDTSALPTSLQTSIYIKAVKDFLMIFLMMLTIIFSIKRLKISAVTFYLGFLLLWLIISASWFMEYEIVFLSGIRWLIPFLLSLMLIGYIDEMLLERLSKVLAYLFLFSFVLQIWQLVTMGDYYGPGFLGLSRRTTGFYQFPTTCGFFLIIVFYVNYFFGVGKLRKIILWLMPLSLIMVFSKTAIVIYCLLGVLLIFKKYIGTILSLLPFFFLSMLYGLYVFYPDAIEISLGERLGFLSDNLNSMTLLANYFGMATNSAFSYLQMLNVKSDGLIFSDSFIGSLPANVGLFGFICFVLIFCVLFYISIKIKYLPLMFLLIIYGLFSFTLSITEAYPMNLLFSVFFAYHFQHLQIFLRKPILKDS